MKRTSSPLLARCGFLFVLVALLGAPCLTAQTTWTGAVSSAWTDPQNWSNGVPNASTDAVIAPATNGCGGGGACLNLHVQPGAQLGGTVDLYGSADIEADIAQLVLWSSVHLQPKSVTCYQGAKIETIRDPYPLSNVLIGQLTLTDVTATSIHLGFAGPSNVAQVHVVGALDVEGLYLTRPGGGFSADPAATVRVVDFRTAWSSVMFPVDTEVSTLYVDSSTSSVGSASGQFVIKPGQQMTIVYSPEGGSVGDVVVHAGGTLHMGAGQGAAIGNVDCQGDLIMTGSGLTSFGDVTVSGSMRVNPPSPSSWNPSGQLALGDIVIAPGGLFEVHDESGVAADSLTIAQGGDAIFAPGGSHYVASQGPIVVDGDVVVDGLLRLNSTRVLQKPAGNPGTLTVGVPGTLELIGTYAAGMGSYHSVIVDNFSLVIEGKIAASYAVFYNLGPGGLRLADTASIAPPPLDLRSSRLHSAQAMPGSALLTIERLAPTAIDDLQLDGSATYGVRATSPYPVTLTDAWGTRSGEAWEDDPHGVVSWLGSVTSSGGGTTSCSPLAVGWALGTPVIGYQGFRFVCKNAPAGWPALFAVGTPSAVGFAAVGVQVHLDPQQPILLASFLANGQGNLVAPWPIPNDPSLVGVSHAGQWLLLEPSSCAQAQFATSNAVTVTYRY